jgi:hypothetical protein
MQSAAEEQGATGDRSGKPGGSGSRLHPDTAWRYDALAREVSEARHRRWYAYVLGVCLLVLGCASLLVGVAGLYMHYARMLSCCLGPALPLLAVGVALLLPDRARQKRLLEETQNRNPGFADYYVRWKAGLTYHR